MNRNPGSERAQRDDRSPQALYEGARGSHHRCGSPRAHGGNKTPEWDKTIRLIVHEPHRFATPPQKGERYTLVDVDLFSGRSLNAKKVFYRAIVNNLGKLGIPADHVKVLLRESAAENWGVRGGVPASEVDLGFKVDV